MISTRLLLAKAFQCPPVDLVPVDEFLRKHATPEQLAAQRKRYARRQTSYTGYPVHQRMEPPMVLGVNAQIASVSPAVAHTRPTPA